MCNLYSMTATREAVGKLFRISHNRLAAIDPSDAIFPSNVAAVVRLASDGERELSVLSWGFVLLLKGQAPKRVTNVRDDKLDSPFWSASFRERRCLVPVTAFSEPKGKRPATWHWFGLDAQRPPFAFAGIWRRYRGPVKKDGETVEIDVYAFLTTKPNELVATVHPSRMPVMLTSQSEHDQWLNGTPDEARALIRSFPAADMAMVQSSTERRDLQLTA